MATSLSLTSGRISNDPLLLAAHNSATKILLVQAGNLAMIPPRWSRRERYGSSFVTPKSVRCFNVAVGLRHFRHGHIARLNRLQKGAILNNENHVCENCGASPLTTFIHKPDFTLWHCANCDLYQKGTPPREGVYERKYHKCYSDRRDRKIITATIRLGSLAPYLAQADPRMLDIGCSVGATVEAARRLGWKSCGVDISAQAVKYCKDHGLDAFKINGIELPFRDASFDVITNWHVIEHVTDINATLNEWFRVLRPGGVMIFEAPDAAYLKAQLLGTRYKKFWPPEHLYAFRRSNMISLLSKAGFEILPYRLIGNWTTLKPHLTTYALAYRSLRWTCRQLNMCKSFEICCRRPEKSSQLEMTRAVIGKAA